MRVLAVVAALTLALGCTPESQAEKGQVAALRATIVELTGQQDALARAVHGLDGERIALHGQIDVLRDDARVLQAQKDGRGVHYILHVSIRQVSYSFSIKKQLRDMVNEESFDMPTDKATYEHTNVGQDLFDSFRAGSALFHGSLGSWRLKVESKKIVTD